MPVQSTLAAQSKRAYRFYCPAFLLVLTLITSCSARAEISVCASEVTKPAESAVDSVFVTGSGVDGATPRGSPETMPGSPAYGSGPQARAVLKEIAKQTIDQPGHFLIGAVPIWTSRYLVGVPWYGWVVTPLLAYREWLQWPSNRWWDPPLDWAFLTLGALAATCRYRSKRRFLFGMGSLRQRIVARRGDTASDLVYAPIGTHARCESVAPPTQCSSKSRIPAMTSRIPTTSVRLGHSWNRRTEAANVNTSST